MKHFFEILLLRNGPLFIFGCCNMLAAFIFLTLTWFSKVSVRGVNAWFKPFKFAASIAVFSWSMAWYAYELNAPYTATLYSWGVISLLGFEIVYITLQAARGQLSHYNISTPVYTFLFQMMGLAATAVTIWTGYIGILFFSADLHQLPDYYLLSIRLAIPLFVIFAFEGAAMGARNTHIVGGPEGGPSLPAVKWSTKYGDLRIAHFIGMHALQVLPVLSWYVFKNIIATATMGLLYASLSVFTLVKALKGKPLISNTNS